MPHTLVSFRCTHCGHLVPAEAAGESHTPHACPVCGKGVHFTGDPDKVIGELKKKHGTDCRVTRHEPLPGVTKLIEHGHWEVLSTASDARLAELGLTRADIEPHTPAAKSGPVRPPVMAAATAAEGAGVKDVAS